MTQPIRKKLRAANYDYGQPGSYFLTICTADKQKLLGSIVGGGVPDAPQIALSSYGKIVAHTTQALAQAYTQISVDKFVIMPNHVHLLLTVQAPEQIETSALSGPPRTSALTIPMWVSTWKRFINREIGHSIWQRSYYDHIIRGDADYREIWQYIDNNPARWQEDSLYTP